MKIAIAATAILLTASCSLPRYAGDAASHTFDKYLKGKYFNRVLDPYIEDHTTGLRYEAGHKFDSVTVELPVYDLYVREVCRKRPPAGYYESGNPNNAADIARCDCEGKDHAGWEKLEIEYLFYSEQEHKFIYITTIPASITWNSLNQLYSTYDAPLFEISNFVNINYFNTFFFGKIQNPNFNILKKGKKKKKDRPERWSFSLSGDKKELTVTDLVDDREVHTDAVQGLAFPVKFYLKKNWQIGLTANTEPDKLDPGTPLLDGNKFYFAQNNDKYNPEIVLFKLNRFFWDKYQWAYFLSVRIKSSPYYMKY